MSFINIECSACKNVFKRQKHDVEKTVSTFGVYRCIGCKKASSVNIKNDPLYNHYAAAKQRCNYRTGAAFKNYGGRGVEFCWKDFESFKRDMCGTYFTGATLDRIDTNGNYCRENCRWATRHQQQQNTRRNIHTRESVAEIRKRYANGETQVSLAKEFGDSQGNISNIVLNKTWREE